MVFAAVAVCPVFGGNVKSLRRREGVEDGAAVTHVVPVPNGVAVVADRFWRAKEALAALTIDWDYGAGAGTDIAQGSGATIAPRSTVRR